MFETVTNLYDSQGLPGEFLLTPLKTYQKYFVTKVQAGSNLEKVAWRVAQIATGIFAYPILGSLAFIGMLAKLSGIPSLYAHNRNDLGVSNILKVLASDEKFAGTFFINNAFYKKEIHRAYRVFTIKIEKKHDETVDVCKKREEERINDLIDRCNRSLMRIFLFCASDDSKPFKDGREILVTFYTIVSSDRAEHVQENELLPEDDSGWKSWLEHLIPRFE